MPRQLFLLEEDFIRSFSAEEVALVWGDMVEMGLANDPFQDFDVVIPAKCIWHLAPEIDRGTFDNWKIKFRFTDGLREDWFVDTTIGNRWFSVEEVLSGVASDNELAVKRGDCFEAVRRLLIVALSARNIRKIVKQNKAARLGIGKAAREGYVTTIRLEVGDIIEGYGSHASPRPHLRAGHIRRQHYGSNMALVKKIWIAPTFVNVDEEFVNSRTAYKF